MKSSIEKAVEIVGGQKALADALARQGFARIKQAHVWNWLNTTRNGVPGEYVIPICSIIDYQVTPHDLRPDLYPNPCDGLPQHIRAAECECRAGAA